MSERGRYRRGLGLCTVVVGALPLVAGCVTQDWVTNTIKDNTAPIETRVARLEANAGTEKARVDQLAGHVDQLGSQVSEARRVADGAASAAADARQRADAAGAAAQAVDGRLTRVLGNRLKRNPVQQVDVSFKSGKSDLSTENQTALQGVVKLLADNPIYTADVVGFTDTKGGKSYNVNLSWRREEAVRRFLVEKGANLNRFFFIGMGEDVATGKDAAGMAKDRRGTVKVYSPAD